MANLFPLEEFELGSHVGGFEAAAGLGFATPFSGEAPTAPGPTYEQGYKAGWEDAAEASNNEQKSISAEFSNNLQDMGFTFHEARSHVVGSMGTLLTALAETLLPKIMTETIGARILEEIMPLAENAADRPIQIVVSSANRSLVEDLISAHSGCPLELVEEPSLAVGQIYLRSGISEREINLDEAIGKVREAFVALAEDNRKVFANG